ncbi:FtsK/SpoIIIE domain-containing protein [Pseudomonas aeruginosa]|nr:FtsK/SpoIIIE domain-containing protein [Pseudomonas aeruginosa]
MVARVQLNSEERQIIDRINSEGWRVKLDQWTAARLALARSLQLPDAPDPQKYPVQSKSHGGVELHSQQFTGEGRVNENDDFTDLYRALLSIYEGKDLFSDDDEFHAVLQRHVRRGLAVIAAEWNRGSDIYRYLADELFADTDLASQVSGEDKQALADKVDRALGQIGIGAKLIDTFEGPRLSRFTFELALLDDLDRLRRGASKLGFALGLGDRAVGISVGTVERTVTLDIPRPHTSWRTVNWSDIQDSLNSLSVRKMGLPICLGTTLLGDPLVIDLVEAPHLFVGGTTGSGKSMCLHAMLLSLNHDSTRAPDLLLIDPKAVEFAGYKGLPNIISGEPVVTAGAALSALNDLVDEMERRQEIFQELGARDIDEANVKGGALKRIVAVVDELGDLFMSRPEIELPLIRLAQKSRSAGIHLVLATQRPEAATFPGVLRSNIPSRIALTVQKSAESRIILDESGAEELLGRGDLLVKFTGQSTMRGHGCRVSPSDISSLLRS